MTRLGLTRQLVGAVDCKCGADYIRNADGLRLLHLPWCPLVQAVAAAWRIAGRVFA